VSDDTPSRTQSNASGSGFDQPRGLSWATTPSPAPTTTQPRLLLNPNKIRSRVETASKELPLALSAELVELAESTAAPLRALRMQATKASASASANTCICASASPSPVADSTLTSATPTMRCNTERRNSTLWMRRNGKWRTPRCSNPLRITSASASTR